MRLKLKEVPGSYWVGKAHTLDPEVIVSIHEVSAGFWTVSHAPDEVSVVSTLSSHDSFHAVEGPWSLFRIDGQLDFSLTGILSQCSSVLAEAGVSLFAISTYNTDYFLVRQEVTEDAVGAWLSAGIGVASAVG